MRLAPDDVRRARLRRGSPVALACASVATLVLSAVFPNAEAWLAAPHAGLLVLATGTTAVTLLAFVRTRPGIAWSTLDEFAWIATLACQSILAATVGSPVSVSTALLATALGMLAVRNPPRALLGIAGVGLAFGPVVRAIGDAPRMPLASFLAVGMGLGFLALVLQTRRLARALAERDALIAGIPRGTAAAPTHATATAVRVSRAPATTQEEIRVPTSEPEHGWDALVERMRSSITVMAQSAGIAARVEAELRGLAPPSSKMRANILRIAQEATTQAIRHVGPRSIVVTLRRADGGVVLELADDGAAGETVRERRSLASLRGRVAAMGGTAEVRRGDTGWVTRVRLPCEQLN